MSTWWGSPDPPLAIRDVTCPPHPPKKQSAELPNDTLNITRHTSSGYWNTSPTPSVLVYENFRSGRRRPSSSVLDLRVTLGKCPLTASLPRCGQFWTTVSSVSSEMDALFGSEYGSGRAVGDF
eukprot:511100-Prorocentrum_minimum.AAC.2